MVALAGAGPFPEGLDLLGKVAGAEPPIGVSHARILHGMGLFFTELDLYDQAERHLDAAEAMARRVDDQAVLEQVLTDRAFLDLSAATGFGTQNA